MTNTPPAIAVTGLTKLYYSKKNDQYKEALGGIDLTIPAGSFFGLLGPNGAGKSTFINILAGITVKTAGKVLICGHDLDTDPRATRFSIGVVPQELLLDPFFTVQEVLDNYAGYYGIPKSQRRTAEIIQALGLSDKAHVKPRSLSGGMKRRLLIAKALVHSPDVLVLDEPTAGVDVELREQLWDYVRELNRQGTTVLLTTHYLEEAEALCDNIAIINHGKIVVSDKTSALLHMLDHKQLTIRLAEHIDVVPETLRIFGASIAEDNKLIIHYHSKEIAIGQILDAISHAKLTIVDLSTKEADLEDIFRYLVK